MVGPGAERPWHEAEVLSQQVGVMPGKGREGKLQRRRGAMDTNTTGTAVIFTGHSTVLFTGHNRTRGAGGPQPRWQAPTSEPQPGTRACPQGTPRVHPGSGRAPSLAASAPASASISPRPPLSLLPPLRLLLLPLCLCLCLAAGLPPAGADSPSAPVAQQRKEKEALLVLMVALKFHPAFFWPPPGTPASSQSSPWQDMQSPSLPCGTPPWSWVQCTRTPGGLVTAIALDAISLQAVNASWVVPLGGTRPVTGFVPWQALGALAALRSLRFSGNAISGSLDGVGQLRRLEELWAYSNQLTGVIPEEISALTLLSDLRLNENDLYGTIPDSLSHLKRLQYLNLAQNGISGEFPPSLGALGSLGFMDLSSNLLGGSLPVAWSALSSLTLLQLQHSSVDGGVPAAWTALAQLDVVGCANCSLTGAYPHVLTRLPALTTVFLEDNTLSGPLPRALWAPQGLQILNISGNFLNGSLLLPGQLRANSPFFQFSPDNNCFQSAPKHVPQRPPHVCSAFYGTPPPASPAVPASPFPSGSPPPLTTTLAPPPEGPPGAGTAPTPAPAPGTPPAAYGPAPGAPPVARAPVVVPVGGAQGWTLPFSWTPPPLQVGDQLSFLYNSRLAVGAGTPGGNTWGEVGVGVRAQSQVQAQGVVREVWQLLGAVAYVNCDFTQAFKLGSAPYTTSPFQRPGVYYFASPPVQQCWSGMKLNVTVSTFVPATPAPPRPRGRGVPLGNPRRASPPAPSPQPQPQALSAPPPAPTPTTGSPIPLPSQGDTASTSASLTALAVALPASLLAITALALAAVVFFKLWCCRGAPPGDPPAKPAGPVTGAGALGGKKRKGNGRGNGTPGHTPLLPSSHQDTGPPSPSPGVGRGQSGILVHGAKQFTLGELAEATGGFSAQRVLGQGSFGEVFYGELPGCEPGAPPVRVAVKRQLRGESPAAGAPQAHQAPDTSFLNEIKILSGAYHRNLVSLRGYCWERGQLLLVYDFVARGSLEDLLDSAREGGSSCGGGVEAAGGVPGVYPAAVVGEGGGGGGGGVGVLVAGGIRLGRGRARGSLRSASSGSSTNSGGSGSGRPLLMLKTSSSSQPPGAPPDDPPDDSLEDPLTWERRLRLAVGSAHGLNFLHNEAPQQILHLDVKSGNILVDEDFKPKVADFGLSKIDLDPSSASGSLRSVQTTRIRGTPGYVDPDCLKTCQLSEKSDVYSFGVVLLELATGWAPLEEVGGEVVHIAFRTVLEVNKHGVGSVAAPPVRAAFARASADPADPSGGSGGFSGARALALFRRFLFLAAWCTLHDSTRRPSMQQVLHVLMELEDGVGRPGPEHAVYRGGRFEEDDFLFDCIEAIAWSQGTGTTQPPHSVAARSAVRGQRTLGSWRE